MIAAITSKVAGLFFGNGIKFGVAAAVLVAVFTWDYSRIQGHKKKAKEEIVKAINKGVAKNHERSRKAQKRVSGLSDSAVSSRMQRWLRNED